MKHLIASKCNCGAITISDREGTFSNSMRPSFFKNFFKGKNIRFSWKKIYCCDHCVNYWGLDLCGCGSGEKVGKCDFGYSECINKEPSQIFMEQRKFILLF